MKQSSLTEKPIVIIQLFSLIPIGIWVMNINH